MTELAPVLYRLRIAPDLERFTFEGRVEITLCAAAPTSEIVLNAVELAVWGCSLLEGRSAAQPCRFRMDPGREELAVLLPRPASGEIVLAVDFTGRINDRMAGFYRSRVPHGGGSRPIAVTQFQESDARRAFPCLDHPGRKAAFEIELEVDRRLAAVSNTAVRAQELLENGRKRVLFERTPVMSTYLVFFGVGDFEVLADPLDPRVRVLTLPGQQRHAAFGLEFGRLALQFSESYFGIPYPLSKLDLIAVPDFAFGAMENWGAITFRENLLLHHPESTSKAGEARICEVIAHEIAHQWFGNLVTPADWKYLWLNESFATYFGYGVVDHHRPEWEVWPQFLGGTAAAAMARDGLQENVAIEIPGGEHLVINTSTAPIIYSKGASILRQIEGYIGPESFQKGLRRYLATHAYGCAESRHLWEAFEAVSDKPVVAVMQSWIGQPGFPIITARREKQALFLTQERFTYLPGGHDQSWRIPVDLALYDASGAVRRLTLLMEERQMRVAIDAETAAYKLNAGQSGFYRVAYDDPENLAALGRLVRAGALPAEDRWGLENDLYGRLLAGRVAFEEYLDFLAHYQREEAYLPLASIAQHLAHAHLVVAPERRRAIAALAGPWFEEVLGRIGMSPRPGEPFTAALLREQLMSDLLQYGCVPVERFLGERFDALRRRGEAVPADILRPVLQAAAWCGAAAEAFAWFERRLAESESEHERLAVLSALGMFRSPSEIARALDTVLAAVPARNQFLPLVAMAANPHALDLLWGWYTERVAELERLHPMLYERVVAALVPACGLGRGAEVRAFFERPERRSRVAADVLRLCFERLEIHERLRRASLA